MGLEMSLNVNGSEYEEEWVFKIQHDGHTYRAVWASTESLAANGKRHYEFLVLRDGVSGAADADIQDIKESVSSFRISQVKREFEAKIEPFSILSDQFDGGLSFDLDDDLLGSSETSVEEAEAGNSEDLLATHRKNAIVELAERAFAHEYLGQDSDEGFYLSTLGKILGAPEIIIRELTNELVMEERIGLHGSVLVPYQVYAQQRAHFKATTGHEDFWVSDFGSWVCNFCGAQGFYADETSSDPKDVVCEEDKHKNDYFDFATV